MENVKAEIRAARPTEKSPKERYSISDLFSFTAFYLCAFGSSRLTA